MKLRSILLMASASLVFSNAFSQTHVTTGTQKYTLLEEGTGTWCGYCPDGSQRLQETVEPGYPRCIVASFHNGDPMALTGDPFNAAYITGFPGASIDRVPFTHPSSSGPVTSINVNRGYWATDVGVRDILTPNFQIDMLGTYDSTTRLLTVKVQAKALVALTGNYRINAYIVQDSIGSSATNYEQHSYMNTTTGSWYYGMGSVIPAASYAHMNVVTNVLGASIYGDTAAALNAPAVGAKALKTYTFTIPTTVPSKYVKVVGLVQKYGTATTDRPIENSARARVRMMQKSVVEVASLTGMEEIELYPNPAYNYIHVEGHLSTPTETSITITNALGQVVSQNVYPSNGATMFAENISTENLSNGMYMMTIDNNGEKATRKFVVAK
ncbi:MAG: T9SS type A sorting domain-containing protein [Bacteroidota bacterium]